MAHPLRRIAVVAAAAAGAFVLWLGLVWPPPSWWRTHWPAQTAFMAMRSRQQSVSRDAPPRRYAPVPADAMSPWLLRAAMAGEDEAFYLHHGIDYHALREALGYRRTAFSWGDPGDRAELERSLGRAWGHRDRLRGASTITQQLAKNLYLSSSRNPLRKLKEAVIAYRLEWALDKSRIMALYLNVAEFGPNLWGVEAASERYFGRPAGRLSADQAALLIATLPHPLTSNPAYRPGRTRWRQQLILLKLGGAPVVVPREEAEDTMPVFLPPPAGADTVHPDTAPPPNDSAAVPQPDTTAAPPLQAPPAAPRRP
jgi:monofunctional biosynthetic peptidoglycan transglycosylase